MMKSFSALLVALILTSCAANSTTERAKFWMSEAKRPGTPKLDLVCIDTCLLNYRDDDSLSVPLDSCSTDAELCLWRDEFINLYIPRSDAPSWSFRVRDYERELDGIYEIIEERLNGTLTKTYFVFEDRVWMVVHSNLHRWAGDDGRGIMHSNAHGDSLLFVIYL